MSRSSKGLNRHPTGNRVHGVGVIQQRQHDPYHADGKSPGGTRCRQCGAVVDKGAWRWVSPDDVRAQLSSMSTWPGAAVSPEPSMGGTAGLCPACERIRGHDAAGVLIIEAAVIQDRAPQIHATLKRLVSVEVQAHPMERILNIQELSDGSCLVETTGLHLLRRLGHGLAKAFSAQLHTHYLEAQLKGVMRLSP